jgi:hypothetical protein
MRTTANTSGQQFEGKAPIIPQEAGNAPEHAKGFGGAGGFSLSHVPDFPTELVEYPRDGLFGRVVVSTNEHGRLATRELGIHRKSRAKGNSAIMQP